MLGIGGVRALRALGISPTVYHMNEGHSAFLALERIRAHMADHGVSFAEAREHVLASNVFTTHTPVPAGNEQFSTELMRKYLSKMAEGRITSYNVCYTKLLRICQTTFHLFFSTKP